jgi:hypothetical protein
MTSAQLLLLASQAVGKLPSATILPGDLAMPAPFNRPYFSYVLFEALVRGPAPEMRREQEDGDGGLPNDAEQVDDPFYDGRIAAAEGWCMMNGDGGEPKMAEIQRDDETRVFIDDDAAIDFVEQRAAAGSPYHRRALVLHAAYEADYASKKES